MIRHSQANWTVMIYANGNNELQPEMWQCKLSAEKVGSSSKVNTVLQISQEKYELAALLRPCDTIPPSSRKWIGARRYFVRKGNSILVKDLGRINMADPMNLYNFIVWAISEYPAEHYMLVLSGHGYQFVGAMTDYSQNAPYIMGIVEMSRAIELAARKTGTKLDLLVLDICYFNFIEVIYELGKEINPAVQNILTYIDHGPLAGLAYDKLLLTVHANSQSTSLRELCHAILASFNADLVAVKIDHTKLQLIKNLYHSIAQYYERYNYAYPPNLYGLIYSSKPAHPWHEMVIEMHTTTRELIIGARQMSAPCLKLLHVATKSTNDQARLALYGKLSFAHNNDWACLLSSKTCRIKEADCEIELKPLLLNSAEVAAYISIMNPTRTHDDKQRILKRLYQYKNWLPTANS